ncbi:MAG TPA: hypothetical protein VF145_07985 [Chitinophagaceae bacterium]
MKILLAVAAFLLVLAATAQPYRRAVGVKFPVGTGISYKAFVSPRAAAELQALYRTGSLRLAGLYEFHFPFTKANGLSWYTGPGVHAGFYSNPEQKSSSKIVDVGIDGVLGLDYKFETLPLNISADWQPSISLNGNGGAQPAWGGVAVRYTF